MDYSPARDGLQERYPLFKPPSPSQSESISDYFDDGLDEGSLNNLVDNIDRHAQYPSIQAQNLPFESDDQQSDRYYSPVPQMSRNSFDRNSSTEFPDQYESQSFYPDNPAVDSTYQDNHYQPVGPHRPRVSGPNLIPVTALRSGKTVIFELAILRMLEYNQVSKGVYMAPTKSLCAERFRDWSTRFGSLGVKCVELTGDSENAGLADAKLANLIITTPEKWDSMTRRWFEFSKLLNKIRLVCIDEVHMLNEERGSVLEVIVARMKTLGTNIRLIALSATVPNISDVAEWLGDGGVADQNEMALTGQAPAKTFIFGEEHRPVKLSKFVYGYTRRPEHTEYQFMSLLNFKLMDHITTHSSGRPTLVFCGTRKSSLQAAETLSKSYQKMSSQGEKLPWEAPKSVGTFSDKKLTELGAQGIGVHHAGLDQSDRRQIESLFTLNKISVLCTTSTLSVGVNLPARCVIIRGTKTYRGGTSSRDGFEDYSELDLIQMMGRAGRPQFDDEGVAVVMTSQNDKMRIEKLVKSETMLESCLHLNLTEHINSEIYMGTIISRSSAIDWLENSFLSVRIKKNPKHYSISDDQVAPDQQLGKFAGAALDLLLEDGLIEEDEDQVIRPTELGEIMSKFCLRHKTFLGLARMKSSATMRNILEIVSGAEEYCTLRLRAGQRFSPISYESIKC
ncbi:Sec63 [Puccinia graminis f. sp. tritici]|uniref:DNA 3'-5' helicase n=1 Tax=Puccinia graminis f. sp. tritici TaxID=56615 RepID=A0A5B0NE74_PUCGR|nr:Sec63 [Puccinia graminis f. sp. tritici]